MSWEQIAEGPYIQLSGLPQYEPQMAEGAMGLLELNTSINISAGVAQTLQSQLQRRGVAEAQVTTSGNQVNIYWRKGFAWLPVIVAIILGLIILAIVIMSWRFFQDIAAIVPEAIPLLAILGIGVVTLVAIYMVRRE